MNLKKFKIILFIPTFLMMGCGYTLNSRKSELMDREGVQKVYVEPIVNQTFKPGIENVVYNELIRFISARKKVILTRERDEADAILTGTVNEAYYTPSAIVPTTDRLFPSATLLPNFNRLSAVLPVATEYSARLACGFQLKRRKEEAEKRHLIWSSGFSRARPFPANNQLGVFGNTAALINESEFDRILREMAQSMMGDLHESMLSTF